MGFEIGAGILPVLVQEDVIERAGEVIVVRHVLARLADRIGLLQPLDPPPDCIGQVQRQRGLHGFDVLEQQPQHVVNGAVRHVQRAIHVGLAEMQVRVDDQLQSRGPVRNGKANALAGTVAETAHLSTRHRHLEVAVPDNVLQKLLQQCLHGSAPFRSQPHFSSYTHLYVILPPRSNLRQMQSGPPDVSGSPRAGPRM